MCFSTRKRKAVAALIDAIMVTIGVMTPLL